MRQGYQEAGASERRRRVRQGRREAAPALNRDRRSVEPLAADDLRYPLVTQAENLGDSRHWKVGFVRRANRRVPVFKQLLPLLIQLRLAASVALGERLQRRFRLGCLSDRPRDPMIVR